MSKRISVVVGRFQVSELTFAHEQLLRFAADKGDLLIVVVGVSATKTPTKRNPLSFGAREAMIRRALGQHEPFVIVPVVDHRSDAEWAAAVDRAIDAVSPCPPGTGMVTLYGGRDSCLQTYRDNGGRHGTWNFPPVIGAISGTEARAAMRSVNSADFRMGVIYATQQQFDAVFPTVDIAIFKGDHILLGRKKNDEPEKWRLPGGFADPKSESYEEDAIREAQEETGLTVRNLLYVGSSTIADWRYSGPEVIKTVLFMCHVGSSEAKAGDDLAEVRWFPIQEAAAHIAPLHADLLAMAIKKREHLLSVGRELDALITAGKAA